MLTLLTSFYALLIAFTNSPQALATLPQATPGEKFSAINVQYHPEDNVTYATWVRYYVWNDSDNKNSFGNNITARGGQVWVYKGHLSLDQVKADGRARADEVIEVSAN